MAVIAQNPFLETSDGVLRSRISMLDSCQEKQITYLVIFRKGLQRRKYRTVSARICIGLTHALCKQRLVTLYSQNGVVQRNERKDRMASMQGRRELLKLFILEKVTPEQNVRKAMG